jgi:hypothetical protein
LLEEKTEMPSSTSSLLRMWLKDGGACFMTNTFQRMEWKRVSPFLLYQNVSVLVYSPSPPLIGFTRVRSIMTSSWDAWSGTIDISCVDWAYKSSTCDLMYCRQRRHLCYGGQFGQI